MRNEKQDQPGWKRQWSFELLALLHSVAMHGEHTVGTGKRREENAEGDETGDTMPKALFGGRQRRHCQGEHRESFVHGMGRALSSVWVVRVEMSGCWSRLFTHSAMKWTA